MPGKLNRLRAPLAPAPRLLQTILLRRLARSDLLISSVIMDRIAVGSKPVVDPP
ncbi:hypothetical protein [Planctomyces sp. SH-PL62]|uniref:hypothetical protein n=1 Tax=Planctomyces sp. SH-PL62 TaxID=1636152 RepID=UPI0012E84595|nr:hypothetical protein [Planctomyces sp. SH-PL62]